MDSLGLKLAGNLFSPRSTRVVTARTQKRVYIDRRDIAGRKLSVHFESTGYRRDVASSLRSELFQEDFAFDEPWISNEKYTATHRSSIAATIRQREKERERKYSKNFSAPNKYLFLLYEGKYTERRIKLRKRGNRIILIREIPFSHFSISFCEASVHPHDPIIE